MFSFVSERLRRFPGSRDGNVSMIFALGSPILVLGIAVAIDFNNATVVRTKLNAAADAASLAALTPAMMQQSDSTASSSATAMFNARVAAINSLVIGQTNVNINITHPNGNANSRQVQVSYTARTNTILGNALGASTLSVSGSATAQATTPPNIDFYLLLDNSPSMALPATSAGITQMQNLTAKQGSCAFACHQAGTNNGDTAGNPCADGTLPTLSNGYYCDTSKGHYQIDNYALARLNNITLRLDELSNGVSTLMQTASGYHSSGIYSTPPTYRFAAYMMNSLWQIGVTNTRLMALTTDYISTWNASKSGFGVLQYYSNDNGCANPSCTSGSGVPDVATNFDNSLSDMLNTLPTPGAGSNQPGDKPQEVLFFVTDGVEDESYGGRIIQQINAGGGAGVNYCDQIKAKGVRIAVLYTEYLPVPSNSFYVSRVQPFQSRIGPALQACASSPDLYYKAAIGDDLGAALAKLFNVVTQQASLSR